MVPIAILIWIVMKGRTSISLKHVTHQKRMLVWRWHMGQVVLVAFLSCRRRHSCSLSLTRTFCLMLLLPHPWWTLPRMRNRCLLLQNMQLPYRAHGRIDIWLIDSLRWLGDSEHFTTSSSSVSHHIVIDSILAVEVHVWLSTLRGLNGLAGAVNLIKQCILLLPATSIGVTPLDFKWLFSGYSSESPRGPLLVANRVVCLNHHGIVFFACCIPRCSLVIPNNH